jgi:hypothetical protein
MLTKQQIKERLDVKQFYSRFLPDLEPSVDDPTELKGTCSFQDGLVHKFVINQENGMWACDDCDSVGNPLQFYMRLKGKDEKETLEDFEKFVLEDGEAENSKGQLIGMEPTGGQCPLDQTLPNTNVHKPPPECNPQEGGLTFPDIVSGLAGEFADLYSQYLEVPRHFLYMSFLTCAGSILSSRLTLESEIHPQPRFYMLLLGESADVRKSTAILKATEFFQEAVQNFSMCWGVGSAEGLQRILTRNNQSQLLLSLDEFGQFVAKCKIQSSVLLQCVNTLFEANRYESHTRTTSIEVRNSYLSILAASTIQTYERTWNSAFTDIGFNNRLFLVPGIGQKKFSIPGKIPDQEKTKLVDKFNEISLKIGERLELKITDIAQSLYDKWYMNLPRSIHSKRLDTYALRFMPLLAINEDKDEVDEEIVLKVIQLCDWQFRVRKEHDPIDADTMIAKMEEKIRRALAKGPKNNRDLQRAVHYTRDGIWTYNAGLKNLMIESEVIEFGKRMYRLASNNERSMSPGLSPHTGRGNKYLN